MYFHESLPALAETLDLAGVLLDKDTVVVRDAIGRLSVAREKIDNRNQLIDALKKSLGGYCSNLPVVEGSLAKRLISDKSAKLTQATLNSREYTFLYIDRRLVGADWLSTKQVERSPTPRAVFYSLKGGVGRSTALSVLAAELARQGKRVLCIDLDLEAPGIGFMLLPVGHDERDDFRPRFGVVDYLLENNLDGINDEDMVNFVGSRSYGAGVIDVVPAVGRETDFAPHTFLAKLSRAVIEDVNQEQSIPFARQVEEMVERFEHFRPYDAVLIDARAGLAEISAAPIIGLSAEIFVFFTEQQQTFRGYKYLFSFLSSRTDYSSGEDRGDWRERVTFVHAKAPATRRERESFRQQLFNFCSETIYDEADDEQEEDIFSYSENDASIYAPHNSTYVRFDAAYSQFDPTLEDEQLEPDLYNGAYGDFIRRALARLGFKETL